MTKPVDLEDSQPGVVERTDVGSSGLAGIQLTRLLNIGCRTMHLVAIAGLFGGHVFDIDPDRLLAWLYAGILSGLLLALIEAWSRLTWFVQNRGLIVIIKLVLLGLIPWLWEQRVEILVIIILISSIGSHMPARFRYYSIIHRRVL